MGIIYRKKKISFLFDIYLIFKLNLEGYLFIFGYIKIMLVSKFLKKFFLECRFFFILKYLEVLRYRIEMRVLL